MRKIILSSALALLLLNGCGGGSSSDNNGESSANGTTNLKTTGTGYYVDSAVEGVDYLCGSQSGTTDENGTFIFEAGEDCNFSIGGLPLRDINASSLDDNITILEDNIEVAQLLQTLDMDGNATNGITIDKNASSKVLDNINLDEIPTDLDKDILDAIQQGLEEISEEYKGSAKTKEEAQVHLDETEKDLTDKGIKTRPQGLLGEHFGNGSVGEENGNENQEQNGTTGEENSNENQEQNGTIGEQNGNENQEQNGTIGEGNGNANHSGSGTIGEQNGNVNHAGSGSIGG
ncbi:hypothetical protein MNB_SV-12-302 [hydrothermal vent metagenome]|uniref:Uncharacterized protein n=1 Tax=hydrothermal vent metagenome TaxID=652676 RepID=A0A1W1BNE9_9ZZZZ